MGPGGRDGRRPLRRVSAASHAPAQLTYRRPGPRASRGIILPTDHETSPQKLLSYPSAPDRGRTTAPQVVISGLGAVSCLGGSVDELWKGLLRADARPAAAPDDCGLPQQAPVYRVLDGAGSAADDGEAAGAGQGGLPGRASGLAIRAVGEALSDAGLPDGLRAETGVVAGTTLGDLDMAESGTDYPGDGSSSSFRVAAAVAREHGLGGPNLSLSTACSAGVYAITEAADLIRDGEAEVVVACGADVYSRVALVSLVRFGLLDPELCRPFDTARQGMVTGEGAAAVVIESAEHARRRGATVLAVLEGAGWSCDAHHPTAPEPGGQQLLRAMSAALDEASGPPGAVILHRAGIAVNDKVESAAVAAALGASAADVPAYGIKGVIGHTAGAAGLFGAVAAVLMLGHGMVPPNPHVSTVDPEFPLRVPVPADGPERLAEPRVLVCGTGFGGNNAAVVLGAAS
ncbi:beta-ketoacyl-[acyl-carrier-protein] synthase family protein [Streptomyces sp. N2-109]|uniref:Beta-ketoacyl-[acyl-carrier-protein] synthase family protein n=1 Tax=Streptomyces gossypii TaxID=2883101 RepID=A0ABT2JP19_9ACTN|nr:beta-ketoacyl-[acyl-carrier-protein] synthase family protein [Streptomyces gossypii]